jgi:hypothetical protein
LVTVSVTPNLMPSWHIAAAAAVCCEFTISWVSCLITCCCVCPGGNSSDCGTTASSGLSHAASALKTLNGGTAPGPPSYDTVTMFRWPVVANVRCPVIEMIGLPPSGPSVLYVGPGVSAT